MISVIVPVYRVEKYLKRCVESILAQTYNDFELLLIDDGSPDECPQICDAYADQDSRVRVFHKENGGLSDARNFGLNQMKGDYITFVDSDDYVGPDYLKILMEMIKENHVKASAIANADVFDDDMTFVSSEDLRKLIPNSEILKAICTRALTFTAWGKLFQRDLFSWFSFPVGYVFEDNLVIPYVLCECESVACSTSQQYYYMQRQDSIRSTFSEQKIQNCEEGIDKLLQFTRNNYPQEIEYVEGRMITNLFHLVIDQLVFTDYYYENAYRIREKYGLILDKVWKLPLISGKSRIKLYLFRLSPSLYRFVRKRLG